MIVLAASSSSTSVFDQPGTLGFLVVFGMAVVLTLLFRSMSKHLRKVRQQAADAQAVEQPEKTSTAGNGIKPGV
ncbi:MAG TPA: hypothetical protein VK823_12655 [Streptosporangiaceae bacterium]|nr:hypothetical protein [Streptosporangiaceae bacterium]